MIALEYQLYPRCDIYMAALGQAGNQTAFEDCDIDKVCFLPAEVRGTYL